MRRMSSIIRNAAAFCVLLLAPGCAHERPPFPHTGYAPIDDNKKLCKVDDEYALRPDSGDKLSDGPYKIGRSFVAQSVESQYKACLFVPVITSAGTADSEDKETLGIGRTQARKDLAQDIYRIFLEKKRDNLRPRFLLLSGGGEHGAFGAGLLFGMYENNHHQLPDYDVVTGISTGSLQSTFVFLANRPLADPHKDYPDYMKNGVNIGGSENTAEIRHAGNSYMEDLVLAYAIDNESELLHVYGSKNMSLIRRGSYANMDPLRTILLRLITNDTLRQVAAEYKLKDEDSPKRLLLVGVANEDDGYGYAIDLTKIAYDAISHYDRDHDEARLRAAREIYIESIIASSSVPPGVPSVTLPVPSLVQEYSATNPQFIDGGARFGIFVSQIGLDFPDMSADVDVVVNGNQNLGDWLNDDDNWRAKLSPIDVGLRAVDILTNQSYRGSEQAIEEWVSAKGGKVSVAYMSGIHMRGGRNWSGGWRSPTQNNAKCKDLRQDDIDHLHPLQFHHSYMLCLLNYGMMRARTGLIWNYNDN
jgi:hypothetical protein